MSRFTRSWSSLASFKLHPRTLLVNPFAAGLFLVLALAATPSFAQPKAPRYEECRLDSIYPSGGQVGSSVVVEFRGVSGGLQDPRDIVIDGPPGIAVKEIKSVSTQVVQATLEIAAGAPPGRRWVRVLNERSGLTNFAYFFVGRLPERLEREPNSDLASAESVEIPTVVNGAITPQADADCFRFRARRGQNVTLAIAAHALDIHGQSGNYGIADFRLELFDAQGRSVAAAEDTLGLDPLIEFKVPEDGEYTARVELLNHQGFPEAVYRLTVGEVPYVTGVFPAGTRRGTSAEVELIGPNIPPGTRQTISVAPDTWFPQGFVTPSAGAGSLATIVGDVPMTWSEHPESSEAEPNDGRESAAVVAWPAIVNGRFQRANDEDWYRVRLAAGQRVWIDVIAHRFVRSPVDTGLEVFDANGRKLAENDDDATVDPGYESFHDFRTTDSRLLFAAPAEGEYFVRVVEQSGSHGPRSVYRLAVTEALADFHLRHFPDAVPIWGPGSTAAVMVRVDRLAGCQDDIELAVEGLPDGWRSSGTVSLGVTRERPLNPYQNKLFVTITAPTNALPGTCAEFRIVGRAKREGGVVERRSWPLTLFYTSDTGFFRVSPASRVAVARAQGPWLEALVDVQEVAVRGMTTLPVRVVNAGDLREMPLVVNLVGPGVGCGLGSPQNLPIRDGRVEVPLALPPEMPPGVFGITIAQTWRSDVRVGMPGPCTPLIKLRVTP